MFGFKKKAPPTEETYTLTESQQTYFDILEQMNPNPSLRKAMDAAKKSLSALPAVPGELIDTDSDLDPISRSYAALTGDVDSAPTGAIGDSLKLKEVIKTTYGMFTSLSEEHLPDPSGNMYNYAASYGSEIDYETPSIGLIYGTLKSNRLLEKGHYLRLSSFSDEITYYVITQIERIKDTEEDFARYDFVAERALPKNLVNKNFHYHRPFHDRDDVFGYDRQRIVFSWGTSEVEDWDKV
jgi:hypothetical protein